MPQQTIKVDLSFGQKVRNLRREKGWRQKELADKVRVTTRTIRRIENVKAGESRSFDTRNLESIAKVLETTLDNLSRIDDDQPDDWATAHDKILRYLQRNESVNLVTQERSKWRELIENLCNEFLGALRIVDLQRGNTVSRRGLVAAILEAFNIIIETLPSEPGEELVILDRRLSERQLSRLALLHFDVVPDRPDYDVNLFAALRYLLMESRKLVLLVQSHKPFSELLPKDHPLSAITIQTVFLRGQE